jgi:hypothetical protein
LFGVTEAVKDGGFTTDMHHRKNIPVIHFLSIEVVKPIEITEE